MASAFLLKRLDEIRTSHSPPHLCLVHRSGLIDAITLQLSKSEAGEEDQSASRVVRLSDDSLSELSHPASPSVPEQIK
jgi:hypothetical protein